MDAFMKRAVELTIANIKEGGQPFGAVLVKDGEIISEGVNELHKVNDISGHAELLSIRRAQEKLGTVDLTGYTMYASGEPCPMCLTAMYFSGIRDYYYCQSIEDAAAAGIGKSVYVYGEMKKDKINRDMKANQMPLELAQENPLDFWRKSIDKDK